MPYLLFPQIYFSLLMRTSLKPSFSQTSFDLEAEDNCIVAKWFISKCSFPTLVMIFFSVFLFTEAKCW